MMMSSPIRDHFLALCHLVCEDRYDGVMHQASALLADYFGAREVVVMVLDVMGLALIPSGGFRRGEATWGPDKAPIELETDRTQNGPLSQAILSGKPALRTVPSNRAEHEICIPLTRANGTCLAVVSLSGEGSETSVSREAQLLLETVAGVLQHAVSHQREKARTQALHTSLDRADRDRNALRNRVVQALEGRLPGRSQAMASLRASVLKLCNNRDPLTIFGVDGAGKERAATELHRASRWARSPFVFVNCRDVNQANFAPLFFGHKRGAIAGVSAARKGYLREAGDGVVYLDRPDLLPESLQGSLARIIETGHYRVMGSERDTPLTARLVSALPVQMLQGPDATAMLPSLYFRLANARLTVPSLDQRPEDLPDLVEAMARACARKGRKHLSLAPDLVPWLSAQRFRGDLRELESRFEQAWAQADRDGGVLSPLDFQAPNKPPNDAHTEAEHADHSLKEMVANYEKTIINAALKRHGFDRELTARFLNIPKRTLADKCKKHQIS